MTISPPRIEPVPYGRGQQMHLLTIAVYNLEVGQMIEITDGDNKVNKNALRAAKRHGYKVTTRRTESGSVKVWRLK